MSLAVGVGRKTLTQQQQARETAICRFPGIAHITDFQIQTHLRMTLAVGET